MRELVQMWGNTRMVVLTAMCASLYAAVLIPFMVVPLIPGVTHFRPANALPVVFSFLFGPAAAWGAAFGNLIGDFFGGLGPGDFFGFVGNFLYALAPYRLWRACGVGDPIPRTARGWALLMIVIGIAGLLCAVTVGFGLHVLGFVPFPVLANVVLINNVVTSMVLAPLLLATLYPRVRRARLLYVDLVGVRQLPVGRRAVAFATVLTGSAAAFALGNLAATGTHLPPALLALSPNSRLAAAVLPGLGAACVGLLFL